MATFDNLVMNIDQEKIDAAIRSIQEKINGSNYIGTYRGKPTIELQAEYVVNDYDIKNMDPMYLERQIKEELALQIARQMIDEDVIEILTNHEIDTMTTRTRAKVKIVQE